MDLRRLPLPILCALLASSGPARAADDDFSKVEIKTTPLGGGVFLLEGAGGNIVALAGDEGVAIVDDQFAPLAPKIEAALAKVAKGPVRFVVNTHWHGDHTGGNAFFSRSASILAHDNVRKRLLAGASILGRTIPPAPAAALPVVTFAEGVTLWFAGEEVRVVHLRPAHTDGDSAVFFTKANVVHLGDAFVTYGFPFIDQTSGGTVRGLIAALDELVPRLPKDAKIVPGHGPVSTVEDVRKFTRTLEEIVAAIDKARAAGKTAGQMKQEKLLEPWAAWGKGFLKADDFIDVVLKDPAK